MISRDKKEAIVAEVNARFCAAQAILIAENGGLSAAQIAQFRHDVKSGGGQAQVIKNTLAKRALAGSPFASLGDSLSGPLIFAAAEDATVTAKTFAETAKANDKFIIRGGGLAEGVLLDAAAIGRLAAIPPRAQLLSNLLNVMQSPLNNFVRTLHEVPSRFVRVLSAIHQQRGDS